MFKKAQINNKISNSSICEEFSIQVAQFSRYVDSVRHESTPDMVNSTM